MRLTFKIGKGGRPVIKVKKSPLGRRPPSLALYVKQKGYRSFADLVKIILDLEKRYFSEQREVAYYKKLNEDIIGSLDEICDSFYEIHKENKKGLVRAGNNARQEKVRYRQKKHKIEKAPKVPQPTLELNSIYTIPLMEAFAIKKELHFTVLKLLVIVSNYDYFVSKHCPDWGFPVQSFRVRIQILKSRNLVTAKGYKYFLTLQGREMLDELKKFIKNGNPGTKTH